jgi:hypothetical protein
MSFGRAESKWETVGRGSFEHAECGCTDRCLRFGHLLRLLVKSSSVEAAGQPWPHDDSVVLAFHRDRYENR